MTDKKPITSFSTDERSTLHSLAEMFRDPNDRKVLRHLIAEGVTLSALVQAYRTQKYFLTFLKGSAGLIVIVGGAYAILKGLWPK